MRNAWIMAFLAAVALGACTKKDAGGEDPKKRLTDYISATFAVKAPEDRKMLTEHLTASARMRMLSWSDDQFREAFVESKRQFLRLAFREVKQVTPNEANVTYEIAYNATHKLDQAEGGPREQEAKVTQKRLAKLVKENGRWLIAEFMNVKELIEYKNELTIQPKTTSQ